MNRLPALAVPAVPPTTAASAPTGRLPAVRQAVGRDLDPLISLMATAFARTRVGLYLVAEEVERLRVLRRFFHIIVPFAMTHGQVDVIAGGVAAAIWQPVNGRRPPEITGYAARLAAATGPHLDRFTALDALRLRLHPAARPHHHLVYLAVHPEFRRCGLGSHLLRHRHSRLDAASSHAYAEALTARDRQFLVRQRYQPISASPTGSGIPQLHAMWRKPAHADGPPSGAV